ncbi:hypothetical protein ACLOJK_031870 [Asimina triloba]
MKGFIEGDGNGGLRFDDGGTRMQDGGADDRPFQDRDESDGRGMAFAEKGRERGRKKGSWNLVRVARTQKEREGLKDVRAESNVRMGVGFAKVWTGPVKRKGGRAAALMSRTI